MGELRGMIPIEALQFPQSYEANFKLKRTYHVKRERTRNRSEVSSWINFDDFIKKNIKNQVFATNSDILILVIFATECCRPKICQTKIKVRSSN